MDVCTHPATKQAKLLGLVGWLCYICPGSAPDAVSHTRTSAKFQCCFYAIFTSYSSWLRRAYSAWRVTVGQIRRPIDNYHSHAQVDFSGGKCTCSVSRYYQNKKMVVSIVEKKASLSFWRNVHVGRGFVAVARALLSGLSLLVWFLVSLLTSVEGGGR